jgi:hypothetical protein
MLNTDEANKYPHLTQTEGIWEIVHLSEWTPETNRYLPLKIWQITLLDQKIKRDTLPLEYQRFRQFPDQHIFTRHQQVPVRTPYPDGPDIFSVVVTRALLSMWFEFSYRNWIEYCPRGTILGRLCEDRNCRNPRHYGLGVRPHTRERTLATMSRAKYDEELVKPIPNTHQPFLDMESRIIEVLHECKAAGDDREQAMSQARRTADMACGHLPIPHDYPHKSLEDIVVFFTDLEYRTGPVTIPRTREQAVPDSAYFKSILERDPTKIPGYKPKE